MKTKWIIGLLLLALALPALAVVNQSFEGTRIGDVADQSDGVTFNVLDAANLSFAGATTQTATVDVGSTYYVGLAWKSSTADPGKVTAAVSGGTLTVTTANATTGTCSAILIGS